MGHRTASSRDVTAATFLDVTSAEYQWLVLSVRVPAQPSRHRVAIWRELRRVGALSIGQGCWALPDVQTMNAAVDRVRDMAERGGGEALVVVGAGRTEQDGACLVALFTADRTAEWVEFLADCKKFDAEIDKEIRTRKFTLAELEEEEQSLERLRRWHRDIRTRDVFGAPNSAEADQQLKHCGERLEEYTEQVFAALHQI